MDSILHTAGLVRYQLLRHRENDRQVRRLRQRPVRLELEVLTDEREQ